MFSKFFYTLKEKGLKSRWESGLICREALDKGFVESSLTQFYYVARMILVKSGPNLTSLTWLLRRL